MTNGGLGFLPPEVIDDTFLVSQAESVPTVLTVIGR